MKVAILSDIHGNHHALDAIIKSSEFLDVKHLFVLGDVVGYYYEPEIVMTQLNKYHVEIIRGNHDLFLLNTPQRCLSKIRKKYGSGLEKALEKLSSVHFDQLTQAPEQKIVKLGNVASLLCHGSPWRNDEYIYPDAPIEKLIQCAEHALANDCHFLFMGHTHYPFIFYYQDCIVANPGSVGQARDKGGVACWQLLDTKTLVLKQMRTPYNTSALREAISRYDPDIKYLSAILERE